MGDIGTSPNSSQGADKKQPVSVNVTCKEREMVQEWWRETCGGTEEEGGVRWEEEELDDCREIWMTTLCVYSCLLKGADVFKGQQCVQVGFIWH